MILEFVVKFTPNLNNIYLEKTDFNETTDDVFVKLFSETIINSDIEKYAESLSSDKDIKILLTYLKLIKCYMNPDDVNLYYDFKKTLLENDRFISESAKRALYACLGSALDNCKDSSILNKNKELWR